MTTTVTIITGGASTDTNIMNKKRPRIVSFSPNVDWLKEDNKYSNRKLWLRQVRTYRGKRNRENRKAFDAFKALADEGNRQFLLEKYEKETAFQAMLYRGIKALGLSHGRGREAIKKSLEELEKTPHLADRVTEKGVHYLVSIYYILNAYQQEFEDSSDSSEASCGLRFRERRFWNITNSGRLSEGSDSTQGSGSATLSDASTSTPSPEPKRPRLTATADAWDESSENR
jgi:hypothetical protein